jgi:type II secretion system protein G
MWTRLRKRQKGFTLIELLIVVAIIGIIAAMLIPNFLDALQKAKQKRTVADSRNVGTAMMSWITDQVGAASAGFSISDYSGATDYGTVQSALAPQYIQELPQMDGWKNSYIYRLNTIDPLAAAVALVCSQGRGGAGCTGAYSAGAFDPTDYEQDILWADGFFVRWPQKLSTDTGS